MELGAGAARAAVGDEDRDAAGDEGEKREKRQEVGDEEQRDGLGREALRRRALAGEDGVGGEADDDGNGSEADLEAGEMIGVGGPAAEATAREAQPDGCALAQGCSGLGGHGGLLAERRVIRNTVPRTA